MPSRQTRRAPKRAAPRARRRTTSRRGRRAAPPGGPEIFRLAIQVPSLAVAVPFYTSLLGSPGRRIHGGRHYFDCGPVILALVEIPEGAQPTPDHLYFAVRDIRSVHARAGRLGGLSREEVHGAGGGDITTRPWGERSFYASDPFGNRLCFVEAGTLFTGR